MRNIFLISLLSASCVLSAGNEGDETHQSNASHMRISGKLDQLTKQLDSQWIECISLSLQTEDENLQSLYQKQQDILAKQSQILREYPRDPRLAVFKTQRFKKLSEKLMKKLAQMNRIITSQNKEMGNGISASPHLVFPDQNNVDFCDNMSMLQHLNFIEKTYLYTQIEVLVTNFFTQPPIISEQSQISSQCSSTSSSVQRYPHYTYTAVPLVKSSKKKRKREGYSESPQKLQEKKCSQKPRYEDYQDSNAEKSATSYPFGLRHLMVAYLKSLGASDKEFYDAFDEMSEGYVQTLLREVRGLPPQTPEDLENGFKASLKKRQKNQEIRGILALEKKCKDRLASLEGVRGADSVISLTHIGQIP